MLFDLFSRRSALLAFGKSSRFLVTQFLSPPSRDQKFTVHLPQCASCITLDYLLSGVRSRVSAHNISLHSLLVAFHTLSFSLSHSYAHIHTLFFTLIFFLAQRVYMHAMCACVYILIHIYTHIDISLLSHTSLPPFLSSLYEIIASHIRANAHIQLNSRRQWLDRKAFDDTFLSLFSFFESSPREGGEGREGEKEERGL